LKAAETFRDFKLIYISTKAGPKRNDGMHYLANFIWLLVI